MKMAYQRLLATIVMVLTTLLIFLTLPVHNLITINLAIITTTITHRLYWEIRLKERPSPKAYGLSLIKTIFWVSTFYILYILAGSLGLWGFLLLSIAIAAWKIYQGRDLFNNYTKWAADRAWGRTKENFDLAEELANEQETSRGQPTTDRTTRTQGQSNTSTQESGDYASEQEHSGEDKTQMQALSERNKPNGSKRTRSYKRQTLHELSEDIRSRKSVKVQE